MRILTVLDAERSARAVAERNGSRGTGGVGLPLIEYERVRDPHPNAIVGFGLERVPLRESGLDVSGPAGGEPVLGLPRWIDYPLIDVNGVVNFPFRTTAMLASLMTIIIVSRLTGRWLKPNALIKRDD